ncbi:MAG: uncharacterized protein KVP18_004784 [Porospora cf. gigantea A]|uniref:uncharacterized protein n=1 Tax=Porospora cf. gigantea A TaxID=2853593 RepID=UPI0035595C74|nr:MAG: hypothetical protein KVP18_004784 [Porospora cf. gigantea A]
MSTLVPGACVVHIPSESQLAQSAAVRRLEERHKQEMRRRRSLREEVYLLRNQLAHLTHENGWLSVRLHNQNEALDLSPQLEPSPRPEPATNHRLYNLTVPFSSRKRVNAEPVRSTWGQTFGKWRRRLTAKRTDNAPYKASLQAKCQTACHFGLSPPVYGRGSISPISPMSYRSP